MDPQARPVAGFSSTRARLCFRQIVEDQQQMNQLEKTIVESARTQLVELQRELSQPKGQERNDGASSAYWMLNGLVMLGHLRDNGMSDDAAAALLAIERETAQVMADSQADQDLSHGFSTLCDQTDEQADHAYNMGVAAGFIKMRDPSGPLDERIFDLVGNPPAKN